MIINKDNGIIKLIAEGNNKLTNLDKSFFSDIIYLGVNDNVENYIEVGKDIWDKDNNSDSADLMNKYKSLEQELLDLKSKLDLL